MFYERLCVNTEGIFVYVTTLHLFYFIEHEKRRIIVAGIVCLVTLILVVAIVVVAVI